ncbi:MAG: Hsp33 family molecular chaperone HslO, partial [Firmicutes bacterium]|nr:Hsp33 family molecular chaperone HslO [Bacillota bacterium]
FIGKIALASGEIAEDLTAYYYISEQQNSAISLGVKIETDYTVGAAGGMIIQLLPGFKDEAVDALENMLGNLPPITTLIDQVNLEAKDASEEEKVNLLAYKIFGDMPEDYCIRNLDMKEIKWECDCSEERLEKALITIGAEDLSEIIEEDGQAEMVCQFCLKKYLFDKEHLERLLESIK